MAGVRLNLIPPFHLIWSSPFVLSCPILTSQVPPQCELSCLGCRGATGSGPEPKAHSFETDLNQ